MWNCVMKVMHVVIGGEGGRHGGTRSGARSAFATFVPLTCVICDCACLYPSISPHPPLWQVWTLKHVTGLMSLAYAHPFARSSSIDAVRQHKDRQQKMSSYFSSGLPYSRYYRIIERLAIFDTGSCWRIENSSGTLPASTP